MDIIIFYILFHSFHILQPLDVKYFGPLKATYEKEIKKIIQMHLTHITKNNFFFVFKQVFFASMNEKNIQTKFQMIDLMLYNLKIIINSLDFRLKTFILSSFCPTNVTSINPIIPKTTKDAVQNSIKLKSKIIIHQNNSLN